MISNQIIKSSETTLADSNKKLMEMQNSITTKMKYVAALEGGYSLRTINLYLKGEGTKAHLAAGLVETFKRLIG